MRRFYPFKVLFNSFASSITINLLLGSKLQNWQIATNKQNTKSFLNINLLLIDFILTSNNKNIYHN
jgi:hypothetical protein